MQRPSISPFLKKKGLGRSSEEVQVSVKVQKNVEVDHFKVIPKNKINDDNLTGQLRLR